MPSTEIPEEILALNWNIVTAFSQGKAYPIPVEQAAQLREHELINTLCKPTERGVAVAGEYEGFMEEPDRGAH